MPFDFSLTDVKHCSFFCQLLQLLNAQMFSATKVNGLFLQQPQIQREISPSHKINYVTGLRCKHGFRKCMQDAKFTELTPDERQNEHFQAC